MSDRHLTPLRSVTSCHRIFNSLHVVLDRREPIKNPCDARITQVINTATRCHQWHEDLAAAEKAGPLKATLGKKAGSHGLSQQCAYDLQVRVLCVGLGGRTTHFGGTVPGSRSVWPNSGQGLLPSPNGKTA